MWLAASLSEIFLYKVCGGSVEARVSDFFTKNPNRKYIFFFGRGGGGGVGGGGWLEEVNIFNKESKKKKWGWGCHIQVSYYWQLLFTLPAVSYVY